MLFNISPAFKEDIHVVICLFQKLVLKLAYGGVAILKGIPIYI